MNTFLQGENMIYPPEDAKEQLELAQAIARPDSGLKLVWNNQTHRIEVRAQTKGRDSRGFEPLDAA